MDRRPFLPSRPPGWVSAHKCIYQTNPFCKNKPILQKQTHFRPRRRDHAHAGRRSQGGHPRERIHRRRAQGLLLPICALGPAGKPLHRPGAADAPHEGRGQLRDQGLQDLRRRVGLDVQQPRNATCQAGPMVRGPVQSVRRAGRLRPGGNGASGEGLVHDVLRRPARGARPAALRPGDTETRQQEGRRVHVRHSGAGRRPSVRLGRRRGVPTDSQERADGPGPPGPTRGGAGHSQGRAMEAGRSRRASRCAGGQPPGRARPNGFALTELEAPDRPWPCLAGARPFRPAGRRLPAGSACAAS